MKGKFVDWMIGSADLLGEAMPGATLVELAGDRRVLIEKHSGVTQYGCNEIRVRVSYGLLCVQGNSLQVALMTKEKLVITGCIDRVGVFRGSC